MSDGGNRDCGAVRRRRRTSSGHPSGNQACGRGIDGGVEASLPVRVETWTKAHWEAAKKEWAKDTTKWANCQKQWNKHKHEGRKSWPSVYKCMTS